MNARDGMIGAPQVTHGVVITLGKGSIKGGIGLQDGATIIDVLLIQCPLNGRRRTVILSFDGSVQVLFGLLLLLCGSLRGTTTTTTAVVIWHGRCHVYDAS